MKPGGAWTLYAAQTGGVGFHWFLGEGASPSCEATMKMIHETHEKHKKKLNNFVLFRVIRGPLFFFHCLWVSAWAPF
jgi:hypothetical protein